MRVVIRQASPQDHEAASNFARTVTLARYESASPLTALRRLTVLDMNDAATSTLIAAQSGALVGLCQLRNSRRPSCVTSTRPIEIARFVIAPELYYDGAGDELMMHALHAAWTREARSVWMYVWEHDLECMAFLERHRFRFSGQQDSGSAPGQPRDWVMTRILRV